MTIDKEDIIKIGAMKKAIKEVKSTGKPKQRKNAPGKHDQLEHGSWARNHADGGDKPEDLSVRGSKPKITLDDEGYPDTAIGNSFRILQTRDDEESKIFDDPGTYVSNWATEGMSDTDLGEMAKHIILAGNADDAGKEDEYTQHLDAMESILKKYSGLQALQAAVSQPKDQNENELGHDYDEGADENGVTLEEQGSANIRSITPTEPAEPEVEEEGSANIGHVGTTASSMPDYKAVDKFLTSLGVKAADEDKWTENGKDPKISAKVEDMMTGLGEDEEKELAAHLAAADTVLYGAMGGMADADEGQTDYDEIMEGSSGSAPQIGHMLAFLKNNIKGAKDDSMTPEAHAFVKEHLDAAMELIKDAQSNAEDNHFDKQEAGEEEEPIPDMRNSIDGSKLSPEAATAIQTVKDTSKMTNTEIAEMARQEIAKRDPLAAALAGGISGTRHPASTVAGKQPGNENETPKELMHDMKIHGLGNRASGKEGSIIVEGSRFKITDDIGDENIVEKL